MRTPPSQTLLNKVVAFSFFCRGLSSDHVADLLGIHRRTVFKWSQADRWKDRARLLADFFSQHPLSVENISRLVIAYAQSDRPAVVLLNQPPPPPSPRFFDERMFKLSITESKSWPILLLKNFPALL